MELKVCFLGAVRRRTFVRCRNVRISATSAACDRVFQFIPRVVGDAIYDLVARNRYRWFGRRDACILPNSDRSWPS
jgi:predicted DCC family thiol-disulfide oxidoreductase YuxK